MAPPAPASLASRYTLVQDLADLLQKAYDSGKHRLPSERRRDRKDDPTHYYVYSFKDGHYRYERTCGTEACAKERVAQYGKHAVYTINTTIRDAFY
jgi:hypothetical protein